MSRLLSISIDVTKLNKSRFYKGAKGTYASLDIWIEDEKDQYGNDASVSESLTKEEREAKAKKNYVGNGKKLYGWVVDGYPKSSAPQNPTYGSSAPIDDEESVPF